MADILFLFDEQDKAMLEGRRHWFRKISTLSFKAQYFDGGVWGLSDMLQGSSFVLSKSKRLDKRQTLAEGFGAFLNSFSNIVTSNTTGRANESLFIKLCVIVVSNNSELISNLKRYTQKESELDNKLKWLRQKFVDYDANYSSDFVDFASPTLHELDLEGVTRYDLYDMSNRQFFNHVSSQFEFKFIDLNDASQANEDTLKEAKSFIESMYEKSGIYDYQEQCRSFNEYKDFLTNNGSIVLGEACQSICRSGDTPLPVIVSRNPNVISMLKDEYELANKFSATTYCSTKVQ